MGKSILDNFEAASKAKQRMTGRWDALTAEQKRLVARIAGVASLFLGFVALILFIRSFSA